MKFFVLLSALLTIPAQAITHTTVELSKDSFGVIQQANIKGDGFGLKAVPVFYDQAHAAFERGVENNTFSTFTPDRAITKQDTLYNKTSPWSNMNGEIYIRNTDEHRRGPQTGHYYNGKDIKSNLHNPRTHSRSGTPVESKKIYISWWFKQQNETRNYFQHQLNGIDASFNPEHGDEFIVDVGTDWTGITKVYGRVVAYNPTTQTLHANYYNQYNSNRLTGKKLTLNKNGASATLAIYTRSPGSNKYLRVWESDGTTGTFRSSWTNTQLYQGDFYAAPRSNVVPRVWNHMEYFADQTTGMIMTKVNGVLDGKGFYTQPSDVAGHSPTIGLIGQDSNQLEMFQEIWMDDIYMDTSFKRITLSNAATLDSLKHQEVQFYSSWTDNQISLKPYYGSLDRSQPIFIFIYDENDNANQQGIPLSSRPVIETL